MLHPRVNRVYGVALAAVLALGVAACGSSSSSSGGSGGGSGGSSAP